MKKLLSTIILSLLVWSCFAQETVQPSYSLTVVKKCGYMDIEGTEYKDVSIELKSSHFMTENPYVNVLVKDAKGKKVFGKKFKHSLMFVFKTGQVEVGKPNFPKIIVAPTLYKGVYQAVIREKEGVY